MSETPNAYSFLSFLRRGLATQITQAPGAAARPTVTVRLGLDGPAVSGGGTITAPPIRQDVSLYGPGDVVGVDPRAIVRTDPRNWITNFDPNYLPFVEFYDEDFPWRYSPDVADPMTGRLRPWLALVVLTDAEFTEQGTIPGRPLPSIAVGDLATLPPPDQTGAWAHVHVNRTVTGGGETATDDMAAVLPRLSSVLDENPDLACSRLMCPRRLEPEQGYHAFLVPAFETGRLAGLGQDPVHSPAAIQSSWVDYPNRFESGSMPYYFRWEFRTAPTGDFEFLVRLLKPRTLGARVGNRGMDVRTPGTGLPGITDPRLGGVLRLGGALKVPDSALSPSEKAEADLYENWDDPYPQPFQTAMAELINLADDYTGAGVPGPGPDPDPLVTPPLYGQWHALARRLLHESGGTPITPDDNWVHELNLDPRFRVPAGIGGRIVREHQEQFMQSAWDQLGDVLEANRRIRAAQFAREVAYSFHANHLATLLESSPSRLLAVSAPMQGRVVPDNEELRAAVTLRTGEENPRPETVAATIGDSVISRTPLSPAMRRAARPGSKLIRRLPFAVPNINGEAPRSEDLIERINSGEVRAAPDKVAPAGVVTVDTLEGTLSGPILFLDEENDPVPNPVAGLAVSADFVISLPGQGVHPTTGAQDSPEATRFKAALNDAYAVFNSSSREGAVTPRFSVPFASVTRATLDGLHPDTTVPRRALGGIAVPDRLRPDDGPILQLTDTPAPDELTEVMAYPVIDLPMFRPLVEMSSELFCPNVNQVPPDSVTLLETNPRFIESFLVGLNHEFARELLWREYPTDQRGSVFRQFWDPRMVLPRPGETDADRQERLRDIEKIHLWNRASGLGTHNNQGRRQQDLVLVIRGELLKKYPTAVIYAHRATPDGKLVTLTPAEELDPPPGKVLMPLYDAKIEPDVYFFGFGLTEEQARGGNGDPGWFFVIKERPGDPRFGLDIARDGALEVWNDLSWPDVQPDGTGSTPVYIRLDGQTRTLTLTTPTGDDVDEKTDQFLEDRALTWNRRINSADLAYILFQAPVLVAVHAREMLGDA